MASLNITKEKGKRFLLTWKINRRVKKAKRLPDKLILTEKQLWYIYLSDNLEVIPGTEMFPEEYLYHTKWNVMEVTVR